MKEICFSNVSLLSHLGLLKLGLTLGLFLMLAEAIVEAGLVDKGASKDGVFETKPRGGGDEESIEDKLRQHLAAANTTRVTLYFWPSSPSLFSSSIESEILHTNLYRPAQDGQPTITMGRLVAMVNIGVSNQ